MGVGAVVAGRSLVAAEGVPAGGDGCGKRAPLHAKAGGHRLGRRFAHCVLHVFLRGLGVVLAIDLVIVGPNNAADERTAVPVAWRP